MDLRVGLPFLLLLVISCIYCEARNLETSDISVSETMLGGETESLGGYERSKRMCILCEQFASQAVEYLKENKTQTDIIETFHRVCLRLHSFQQQCAMLVDYYAPLFFLEVALVRPHDFCRKFNLCEDTAPPPPPSTLPPPPPPHSPSPLVDPLTAEHICDLCHNAVMKILVILKDPGTELKIVERLVKGCAVAERFVPKCQNLIFQYGPMILVNAVRLLEREDVCVTVHACQGNMNETAVPYSSAVELPLRDM